MNGIEWLVEAHGCSPESLSSLDTLKDLFAQIIGELDLHPCGEGQWRQFPESGGITGLCLLTESPLAGHTFPEYGTLCLNLLCCRSRPEGAFEARLQTIFRAERENVRRLEPPSASAHGAAAAQSPPW